MEIGLLACIRDGAEGCGVGWGLVRGAQGVVGCERGNGFRGCFGSGVGVRCGVVGRSGGLWGLWILKACVR